MRNYKMGGRQSQDLTRAGQELTRAGPGAHQGGARSSPGRGQELTRAGPGAHQKPPCGKRKEIRVGKVSGCQW
ncbi:unnamed protein product [Boreogadus saida]